MTFAAFMSGWGWVLFSVVSAAFSAVVYLAAQRYKQPGDYLVFWSRVVIMAIMATFMRGIEMPRDPLFYLAVFGTALCAILADVRTFDVTAKYGAGVVSRVQPLVVWGAFFLWFPLDPGLLSEYAHHPGNTALILAALGGCVWFANHQNKCPITRQALIEMLPALAGYSVTAVFNKYAMQHGSLSGAAFGYMFWQSALAVPLLGAIICWKYRGRPMAEKTKAAPQWRTRAMALAALATGSAWVALMAFKNYAMAFTPSPSYQAAVSLTTPLFVSLWYRATGHREEADVKAGMGVVACAILLALVTVR
jgi:hypothetical protein